MKNAASKSFTAASEKPSQFKLDLECMMRDNNKTYNAVSKVIHALGLPMPDDHEDYLCASEGAILFSSRYGIVIRIEFANTDGKYNFSRINDNPWILQPLASIRAGNAIVDICPGVETTKDSDDVIAVMGGLASMGIDFWDASLMDDPQDFVQHYNTGNVGVLPIKSPLFPKGIPVVIDRLGVTALSTATRNVRIALDEMEAKEDPQKKLYAPLREAFRAAWPVKTKAPDAAKMRKFWKLCEASVKKGILIAGWDHAENDIEQYKQGAAADSALYYDLKIAKHRMR